LSFKRAHFIKSDFELPSKELILKGIKRIEFLKKEGIERARRKGEYIRRKIKEIVEEDAVVKGTGLFTVVEFKKEKKSEKIIKKALRYGLILEDLKNKRIGFFPSFFITDKEIEKAFFIFSSVYKR